MASQAPKGKSSFKTDHCYSLKVSKRPNGGDKTVASTVDAPPHKKIKQNVSGASSLELTYQKGENEGKEEVYTQNTMAANEPLPFVISNVFSLQTTPPPLAHLSSQSNVVNKAGQNVLLKPTVSKQPNLTNQKIQHVAGKTPLILRKVSSPFTNIQPNKTLPVGQTKILDNIQIATGNVFASGSSTEVTSLREVNVTPGIDTLREVNLKTIKDNTLHANNNLVIQKQNLLAVDPSNIPRNSQLTAKILCVVPNSTINLAGNSSKPVVSQHSRGLNQNVSTGQYVLNSSIVKPSTSTNHPLIATIDLDATKYECVIPGCTGKKFFYIPSDSKKFLIWNTCLTKPGHKNKRSILSGINNNDFKIESGKVLCDRHFIAEDFLETPNDGDTGILKEHVVPSLNPVHTGCVIPGCANKEFNTPNMYSIPIWRKCTIWLEYVPHLDDYSHFSLLTYRVCQDHFSLVTTANMYNLVPTRNLPSLREVERLRAMKIGASPEDLCAFLLCSRTKPRFKFTPFPADFETAKSWLQLACRDTILQQGDGVVQKFVTASPGVCAEHHVYITHYTKYDKPSTESSAIANVIDQLPLLAKPVPTSRLVSALQNKKSYNRDSSQYPQLYVPMREYCTFINCATHIKSVGMRKYRFPVDQNLALKWKNAAGVPSSVNVDLAHQFICGKHFEPSQYSTKNKLQVGSVPQTYLTYNDDNATVTNLHWVRKLKLTSVTTPAKEISAVTKDDMIPTLHQAIKEVQEKANKKQPVPLPDWAIEKCCVKNCGTEASSGQKLMMFPHQPYQKELFLKAILDKPTISQEDINMYKRKRICQRHFKSEDLLDGGTAFKPSAVPFLHLHTEPVQKKAPLDTRVVWEECKPSVPKNDVHQRLAILHEDRIEFPSMKRQLKFGKDCPKKGINRFPYDIQHFPFYNYGLPNINPGQQVQVHSAIIIDDDDEVERKVLAMLRDKIMLNNKASKRLMNRLSRLNSEKLK